MLIPCSALDFLGGFHKDPVRVAKFGGVYLAELFAVYTKP
jgi:hypothetical protein